MHVKTCTAAERSTIGCSNDGSSVTVTGTQPQPQHPGSAPSGSSAPAGSGAPATQWPTPEQIAAAEACVAQGNSSADCAIWRRIDGGPPASAPGAPAISITDLVSLSPATATPSADPGNVGIAGLPTNFVTTASVHTRTGTLFGAPLTARFTPVGYDFTYGDGTTAHTTAPGATWDALHQPQFTPTATSHVYDDRGTYDTTVTIHYTAEIDLGTGYIPLTGTLTTPGPTQTIRIYEAHTALVQHTCTERPTAPGC
ncbi:hypothetical protein ACFY9N_01280 [Microbacterium sp. NPDC008134]|uniref:hypothetical protein n=1 Tax=Microbacterium sp. NPDC008134 TaxID=3364183 RepID=UPI0036E71ABA